MADKAGHPGRDAASADPEEALRRRAEEFARGESARSLEDPEALAPEEARRTLHELRVHQIELELQNEELRRAQGELDVERARYFDLYDLAPVGYCTLSEQGRILQGNLTVATLLGVERGALAKQPISRFILDADKDLYHLHRKRLFESGGSQSLELRMLKRDGTAFWAHLVATVTQDADGAPVCLAVLSDISARRAAEDRDRALLEQTERAQFATQAKSAFLSRMSHELRTPLNAILGFAQLLGMDHLDDEQRQSTEHILVAGRHLLDLINEVLDISRIETGQLEMSLEPVDLDDLVADAVSLLGPAGAERRIALRSELPDGEWHILADRQRLKQVLLNLLGNAVKYSPPGAEATVATERAGDDRVRISVTDTGPGIPPELLPRLFVPFDRLGAEASETEGTGLGLALSKGLVEAMGGTIVVDSTPGQGSRFWFELSAAEPAAPRPDDHPLPTARAQGTGVTGTVLYIEDDLSNVRLVERVLALRGEVRLIPAMLGRLGLDLAREHRPDLVLLDLHLPDMGGEELLGRLRADPATRAIPVVVLSADATPGQVDRLLAQGARAYLTKPLDVTGLLALVDDVLAPGAGTGEG